MSWPTLTKLFRQLEKAGCHPGVCRKGAVWHAHVDTKQKHWAESNTPFKALKIAVRMWKHQGSPIDGMIQQKMDI